MNFMSKKSFRYINSSAPKIDALAKARGNAKYTDDLEFDRMLYGKLLRSTLAHGRIKKIDVSKARALRGVRAILTGTDLPIRYGILPVSQDELALALGKVRYIGEPVAAVAATSEETAFEALKLIRVEYEPIDPVLSIKDALKSVQSVHDEGNLHKAVSLEFGQTQSTGADYSREDLFYYEGNTHLALEEHSAVALWQKGRLTLHSSSQTPFLLRKILAKALEIPETSVRVKVAAVGGGFGGKLDPFAHEICAAKIAMITGRPVKFTLTREEVFYCHRGRHPAVMWIKTDWKKDGRLLDMHFKAALDGGAYGSFGVVCVYYQGALQPVTYKIPHYRFESARYFTNKPPCGPKRGHGTPQPRFALEVHLDKVAEELGQDPVALRLKNLMTPDSVTVNQLKVTSCGLNACIEKVAEVSGFRRKHGRLPPGKGVGFALGSYLCGAAVPIYWNDEPHTTVRITAGRKSGLTVYCGATDIGQGCDMVVASVVAEILGISIHRLRLVMADTDTTPPDLGSYSSRVTLMAGNAAKDAAEKFKSQVLAIAGKKETSFERTLQSALRKKNRIESSGSYKPPAKLGRFKGSGVGPSPAYSFSACVAEVTCDVETGEVGVSKITFAHDIGRAINRLAVEGQIEGGIAMALGEAFFEEQVYDERGLHRKPSILDYKIPTMEDMPELEIFLVETGDPAGPFGAKEVGQGPLLPVIPAIANAIYDAVGVRIDETPFTPEKILLALERKAMARAPRVGPDKFPDIVFPEPFAVRPVSAVQASC
ncbi:MAG: molybdopterin-dependent oxidoreductase [Elusimicrobia bacterium]|nr:molybdopterin-dependent oxidoreductase [Elusimicrobiota bacterium]